MVGDSEGEDRPLTRRDAREPDGDSVDPSDAAGEPADTETPVRGVPLTDAAFPSFDAAVIPPRPPLPGQPGAPAEPGAFDDSARPRTGDHTAIRDQLRAARDDFESHVHNARDQFEQTNERIKQRTGRDLLVAIGIGVAFGAVLLASLIFFKWLFVPVVLAAALLGIYELARAMRSGGRRVDIVPQIIGGTAIVITGYFADLWLCWVVLFASVAFVSVWRMIAQMLAKDGRTYGDVLSDVLVGGFIQVYVPFLASVALMLLSQEGGEWWVLAFIAIAVVADTSAYAAGLAFGKHPMAPRISPKKTWEGFAGAVLGSLVAGVLLSIFLLHLEWWCGLILGAAILLSATLGDLGESMLKRDLGIKDMSSWLPGHGGLLDRLDSILPSTVPAVALYFLLAPWTVV